MTSVPRDPAFWKRFSTAIHLDEEKAPPSDTKLKHSDSWLARQHAKKRQNRLRLCLCALAFAVFVTAIVLVVFYLANHGSLSTKPAEDAEQVSS